jgi:hypothetical protein
MGRKLGKPLPPALARIAKALGTQDLTSIAAALGVPYSTVRNWHQREHVPLSALHAAAARTGRSVESFSRSDHDETKKFDRSGSEINQTGAGDASGSQMNRSGTRDAFAVMEPPAVYGSGAALKVQTMRAVIVAVVGQLEERGLRLPPAKLADLIVLIYEHLASDEVEEEQVKQTASRYLRLVV